MPITIEDLNMLEREQQEHKKIWGNIVIPKEHYKSLPSRFSKSTYKGGNDMATLKEAAKGFQPKQIKNIADLSQVSVDFETYTAEGTDKDGKPYTYEYIEVNGERYRVPDSVLNNLKAILSEKPNLKTFKVKKTGTGLNTQYNVIPLD